MCIIAGIVCFGLLFVCFNAFASPSNESETVVMIIDGDTIVTSKTGRVRIKCIDAPESNFHGKSQYFKGENIGKIAKEELQDRLKIGETIVLDCGKNKSYNRSVCDVYLTEQSIANDLILDGIVHIDERYCTQREIGYLKEAKENKRGFWELGEWEQPKKWREKN